jgi:RND family efflux transporter MFP subunit
MRPVLRWVVVVAVAGLGAGVAGVALAAGDGAGHYRLATAAIADVTQTVATDGTVDVVNRADVSFGTAGTVATLSARPGQRVRAGQRLGTLDTATLQAAVDSATATLANAKATLASDQQHQADAVDQPDGAAPAGLAKQQQAVRGAQTAAGKAMAAAKAALSAQAKACATPKPNPPGQNTPQQNTPKAAAPTQDAVAQQKVAAQQKAARDAARCSSALTAASAAQDKVARAQDALQRAVGALVAALSSATSQQDSPNGRDEPAPTAATIAADQAAVDTAEADLLAAQQSLSRATLTAPIAGTVASVSAAAGDPVSAGSPVVVLLGSGAAVVEASVPVERIAEVAVGQAVTVTPSGGRGLAGEVTRIGKLADDSADAVAYPVTVTVDEPGSALPAGSTARADIVVGSATGVLTVPTSAVHGRTVTVLAGEQATQRDVTLGAVGPLRTEITGGLTAGERVVLADLDEPLPSAGDQQLRPGGLVVDGGGPRRGGPPVRQGR